MPAGVNSTEGSQVGTSTSLGHRLCPFDSKKARYFSRSSSVFINEIYRSIYAVGRAEGMIEVDPFTTFFVVGHESGRPNYTDANAAVSALHRSSEQRCDVGCPPSRSGNDCRRD